MSIRSVTPEQARQLVADGAVLLDVREADEYARERIPQARNVSLAALSQASAAANGARALIFHCRSGARTGANASRLAAAATAAGCDAYVLEGGLDAWKRAGLPVLTDAKQPMEIMRQVQITAGGLVVLGVVLGATVVPMFYGLAALIGAGLMFSGISGTCAMANMLRRMPWNRRTA
jgi:rhodanese-related sulfurtransferase